MDGLLHIHLGGPESPLDLGMVENLAEHLRGAFRELAREAGAQGRVEIRFPLKDVRKGSLILDIGIELEGIDAPEPQGVATTLISDIDSLAADAPRATMGTGLLQQYRAIIGIAQKAGGLKVRFHDREFIISPDREFAFRAALRERPEVGVIVSGTIESVNIHSSPWRFGLYTKFDRERVDCRFSEDMLDRVLDLMERKALVAVYGEGLYGVAGVTPQAIVLDRLPEELIFSATRLLSFRRSATITRDGEDVVRAVSRMRQENALYG